MSANATKALVTEALGHANRVHSLLTNVGREEAAVRLATEA